MTIRFRQACPEDASAMANVQNVLFDAGKRANRVTEAQIHERYLAKGADEILCTVAVSEESHIVGFQSLRRAWPDNPYDTPAGWGIIGTHISPGGARQGIGRHLFEITLKAAQGTSLDWIEAVIGITNVEGQAYYEAMGFRTWRITDTSCCKRFKL